MSIMQEHARLDDTTAIYLIDGNWYLVHVYWADGKMCDVYDASGEVVFSCPTVDGVVAFLDRVT